MWAYLVLALAVGLGASSLRRPAADRFLVIGTLAVLAMAAISEGLLGGAS